MGYKAIRSALVEAYLQIADWPTVFENNDTPVETMPSTNPDPKVWATFSFSSARSTVATLGSGGLDSVTGEVLIALYYPINHGMGSALKDTDRLREHFVAGASFEYEGQLVKIRNCTFNDGLVIDAGYRVTVTIYWQAWVKRPAI